MGENRPEQLTPAGAIRWHWRPSSQRLQWGVAGLVIGLGVLAALLPVTQTNASNVLLLREVSRVPDRRPVSCFAEGTIPQMGGAESVWPSSRRAAMILPWWLARSGRCEVALRALAPRDDLKAALLGTEICLVQGDSECADATLARVLPRRRTEIAEWLIILAEQASNKGQFGVAAESFRRGLNLTEPRPDVLRRYGETLVMSGRPGAALAVLEHAVRLQPENAEGQYMLGTTKWALEEGSPAAVRHIEKAVALRDYHPYRFTLASYYVRTGQAEAARAELTHLLRLGYQREETSQVLRSIGG
jgi:hypothetical protein